MEAVLASLESVVAKTPRPARTWLFEVLRHVPGRVGLGARYVVFRTLASRCGRVVAIFPGCYLNMPSKMYIGDHVSIHPLCYLDASGDLTIGNDVSIAHGVTVMTTEHDYRTRSSTIREAPLVHAAVVIGNDVWIGAGAKILAGVTVGDHVVIGAGAVVTRNVPANTLAVGIPARVIKAIGATDEA